MSLTPRQQQIASLVAKGMTDKAIARETGLAIQTVAKHVQGAADRIPVDGRPRYKCMVWFFDLRDES